MGKEFREGKQLPLASGSDKEEPESAANNTTLIPETQDYPYTRLHQEREMRHRPTLTSPIWQLPQHCRQSRG